MYKITNFIIEIDGIIHGGFKPIDLKVARSRFYWVVGVITTSRRQDEEFSSMIL